MLISVNYRILSVTQKSCTGKETALIAIQQENGRLKEQMDQMKRQMDLLKVEKEQFEGRSLQLDSHLRHVKVHVQDVT